MCLASISVKLLFLVLLTVAKTEAESSACEQKEKHLALLDLAKESISKAKDLHPVCFNDSKDSSECGAKEKVSAFLDIAGNLIEEAKKNYTSCDVTKNETKVVIIRKRSADCSEILANGRNKSGQYTIWPKHSGFEGRSLEVYCDMDTDGGGWTVIQRRGSFSGNQESFYRGWNDYKKGFGDVTRSFWLGNENIYLLTIQSESEVRFDLTDAQGDRRFAKYQTFWLGNETTNYTLHISNYEGDAVDSMAYHNGHMFVTWDTEKFFCARERTGAWWYDACTDCNLNGLYQPGVEGKWGITWYGWHNEISLAGTEIKIRKKN